MAEDIRRVLNLDLPVEEWGREEGIDELLSYTETKTIHLLLGGAPAKD